ncbi:SusE domain-containing protein [Flavobacterium bizetiae]|uniref:SusE domain-containing protein n=1 Tax=Flavobacterium bizetiae TaxID=2704140 RepID=UPI003757082D
MKNILKLGVFALLFISATACDSDDDHAIITPGEGANLTSPATGFSIVLSKETENDVATVVEWDAAEYNGPQTLINYTIEIAKGGTNFSAPVTIANTTGLSESLTVSELNSALVNAGFATKVASDVDIRVKSIIGTSGVVQYSNVNTFKATPYRVPLATSHWLVGAATPGGWTWEGDAETEFPLVPGQTKIYQVTIVLKSGEAFREFLGNDFTNDGNWGNSHNYTYYTGLGYNITSELVDAGDGDHNFKYTGATGARVFKIDNVAKTITLD